MNRIMFGDCVYRLRVDEVQGLILCSWEDVSTHVVFATSSATSFNEALDLSLEQLKKNIRDKSRSST